MMAGSDNGIFSNAYSITELNPACVCIYMEMNQSVQIFQVMKLLVGDHGDRRNQGFIGTVTVRRWFP